MNGSRKLTAREVLKIYRSRWTANASEVALRYGISRSMVYKIYRRAVWSSVLEHLKQEEEIFEISSDEPTMGIEERSEQLLDGTTV